MACMACAGHEKMPHTCVPPSDAKHECVSSPEQAASWEERRRDTGAAERRKYALLASATVMLPIISACRCDETYVPHAVDAAERLLAEIERRQK